MNVGSRRAKRRGGRIRASEAEDLMSRGDQFFDDGGAKESGRASNKDAHRKSSRLR